MNQKSNLSDQINMYERSNSPAKVNGLSWNYSSRKGSTIRLSTGQVTDLLHVKRRSESYFIMTALATAAVIRHTRHAGHAYALTENYTSACTLRIVALKSHIC